METNKEGRIEYTQEIRNKIIKLLIETNIESTEKFELNEDYNLFLDLEHNYEGATDFLRESKGLRFQTLRKVK